MAAKFTNRRIVQVATVAALYAVFTVAIAPLSYGPIQFRVSEVFKALVLFDPWLSLGIGIGTFFANLASPFVGPWELIWMPLTDIFGGLLAWTLYYFLGKRWAVLPMALYALTTGMAVGLMLWALGLGGFVFLTATVTLSELVILIGGLPIMRQVVEWMPPR
jgi:uncharacterized membrane protein